MFPGGGTGGASSAPADTWILSQKTLSFASLSLLDVLELALSHFHY